MLVLAGPGSGKTTVISERVRYLIEEKGVEPGRILIITFTKAAALEMQSRCQVICPKSSMAVFGTFHSVYYHILRQTETYQNFSLINEKEKKEIMKKIIPVGNMTELQHNYVCENMLKRISLYKNSQKEESEDIALILKRYNQLCFEQAVMDFDDMLILCLKLLRENKEECKKWQERFEYILVDEFQDVNYCQYETLKILSEKCGNIFAVGDDDQAIYSFRGSDPGLMKKFLADFPDSKQICLEDNYRSGEDIISCAGACIRCNRNRFAKNIVSKATFEHMVQVNRFEDGMQEMKDIITKIQETTQETAVLVRTNMQAEFVAETFSQNDIKFVFHEHRKCFYDNVWVKEILAVLRFVFCGQRRSDFFAFMNKPFRGFERTLFTEEKVDFKEIKQRLSKQKEYSEVKKELEKMEKIFRLMRGMEPYGAVLLVLNGMKFRTYVKESAEGTQMMQEQSEEVLEQLLARAKDFRSVPEFLEYVSGYSRKNESENVQKNKEGVRILTYHASKGLEFERVFLPMLNEGSVPRGHIFTQEQLEEERRMFYVAITRAKRFLYLSYHGKESVFLKEIST